MITSLTNPKVKYINKLLTDKRFRIKENVFVVETENLIEEARKENLLLESYTIDPNLEGELVSFDVMKKMSSTSSIPNQIGLVKRVLKEQITEKVLVLDNIQDPGNIGTLIRSALAFGFKTVFLSSDSCDIFNSKVLRSTEGAIFHLNIIVGNIEEFLIKLSITHTIYSTDVRNGIDVSNVKENKIAVILGNEGKGVREEVAKLSSKNLYIPTKEVESLNVGVAGSIIMYELSK